MQEIIIKIKVNGKFQNVNASLHCGVLFQRWWHSSSGMGNTKSFSRRCTSQCERYRHIYPHSYINNFAINWASYSP